MTFSSVLFLFYYLPVTIVGYFLVDRFAQKYNNLYLIVISLLFYSYGDIKMVLYIVFISLFLLCYGRIINKHHYKSLLIISIIICVLPLGYFKYINFFINNLNRFLHMAIPFKELIAPIGISFVSFEALTYLVDVYNGQKSGNFFDILLFISFFPKVISGPIVSWKRFEKQIKRKTNLDNLVFGFELFIIGLVSKTLIADILGSKVSLILDNFTKNGIDSTSAILASLYYAIEIYYDFAGYSNMAVGLAIMFGFKIDKNFNEPYRSLSIREFWRRWHISLGTWFKEYIYIPLGGSHKNVYRNLLIIFVLTGIWHGAGWNFILWGLLNGIIVILERICSDYKWYQKIPNILKHLFVLIFVYFSWTSFCFDSIGEITLYIKTMFGIYKFDNINYTWKYFLDNRIMIILIFAVLNDLLIPMVLKNKIISFLNNHMVIKYLVLIILFVATIICLTNSSYSPFIYYRF